MTPAAADYLDTIRPHWRMVAARSYAVHVFPWLKAVFEATGTAQIILTQDGPRAINALTGSHRAP